MTNDKLFDLTYELLDAMEEAIENSKDLEVAKADMVFAFVHAGDKEYVNPNYISFEDQQKLIQLKKFVKKHPELSDVDLKQMFWLFKTEFAFFIEVQNVIPNLIAEINAHKDDKHLAYLYFGLKQTIEKENEIKK